MLVLGTGVGILIIPMTTNRAAPIPVATTFLIVLFSCSSSLIFNSLDFNMPLGTDANIVGLSKGTLVNR